MKELRSKIIDSIESKFQSIGQETDVQLEGMVWANQ